MIVDNAQFSSQWSRRSPEDAAATVIRKALLADGYAHVDASFLDARQGDMQISKSSFLESILDNPIDPHCAKGDRRRRYGIFVLHPWSGVLDSVPPIWD